MNNKMKLEKDMEMLKAWGFDSSCAGVPETRVMKYLAELLRLRKAQAKRNTQLWGRFTMTCDSTADLYMKGMEDASKLGTPGFCRAGTINELCEKYPTGCKKCVKEWLETYVGL